jgi:uncharacterized membrane protein YbhN (UPF0104 family)
MDQFLRQTLLGLVLTLFLTAFVVRKVDWGEVWAGLRQADWAWCGVALATVLLTTAAKVYRWQCLFPVRRPRFLHLAPALLAGQATNALLPLRLGELVRSYLIGDGLERATALGTVVAEKTLDLLFLLLCAGLTATLASLPPWLDTSLASVTGIGGLMLMIAITLPKQKVLSWMKLLPGRAGEWLRGLFDGVFDGLMTLRRPRAALTACAWSAVIWTLAAVTNYVLFSAFRLSLPIGAALLLLTLLHVGVAPPSSPTKLGIFHSLAILALEAFGVERSLGLAYATVLHLIVYLPQVVLGGLALALYVGRINLWEHVA